VLFLHLVQKVGGYVSVWRCRYLFVFIQVLKKRDRPCHTLPLHVQDFADVSCFMSAQIVEQDASL
jgi:hypothetical protein